MTTKLRRLKGDLTLKAIVGVDDCYGIGKDRSLPWHHSSADMRFFKVSTLGRPVIMGRHTWESLPEKFRPLPDRLNIVLSTTHAEGVLTPAERQTGDVTVLGSVEAALKHIKDMPYYSEAFIIGGATLYNDPDVIDALDEIWIAHHAGNYVCDTFVEPLHRATGKGFVQTWQRTSRNGTIIFRKFVKGLDPE